MSLFYKTCLNSDRYVAQDSYNPRRSFLHRRDAAVSRRELADQPLVGMGRQDSILTGFDGTQFRCARRADHSHASFRAALLQYHLSARRDAGYHQLVRTESEEKPVQLLASEEMASVLRLGGVYPLPHSRFCAGDHFVSALFGVRPHRQLTLPTAV